MKTWRAQKGGRNYLLEFKNGKLRIWSDQGTRESAGGKTLTAGAILRKEARQEYIKGIVGEDIFLEILAELEKFQAILEAKNPKLYSKK